MMNFYLTQSKKSYQSADGDAVSMHSYLVVETVKRSLGQEFKNHKLAWETEDSWLFTDAPEKITRMPDGYQRFEISEPVFASLRLLAETQPMELHTLTPFSTNRTCETFNEQHPQATKEFHFNDVAKSLKQIVKDIMTV
ncbi:hypothetical protein H1Q58_09570 [Planococcus maritimus]|uniref:Uncharacterized protein n=1 Tax=Planococcus maritimus TaxID=192421 RepID=A0A7D7MGH8_PLAMR|nr:hypothetical protein [Planococcus maritimus]QMT16228.1 hypothetical protein H1Q58_09570 [Planococcus maritimus]